MEILDNNKTYKVEVRSNIVTDFIEAMFLISRKNELIEIGNEMQFTVDNEFEQMVEHMEKNLSRFMKQELDYFFNLSVGGIGHSCYYAYFFDNPDIKDISKIISYIETSDIDTFILNTTSSLIGDYIDQAHKKALFKEKNYNELIDLISKHEADLEIKEKLIESLKNPIEAKQRFCLLLKQFYQKSYKIFEDKILNVLSLYKDNYEKLLKTDARYFFKEYTNINMSFYTSEKILIFPSYSKQIGICSTIRSNQSIIVIGIKNDEFYGKKAIKERVQKFFKVLCDKKRLDIIDLLGDRPHYVQEMADKLDLTSATISYHMNFLFSLDLVYLERDEHRVYYFLNKEKAREMFDEAIKLLLHE